MQMDPHRFDPSMVPGDAFQIGGQQPSRPYRAGHVDTAWVQVDYPSQLRQPLRRDLERSSGCLVRSQASRALDLTRIAARPGLGFPGQTYVGSYTYHYALLPLEADVELRTAAYNHSLLWAFFPDQRPTG